MATKKQSVKGREAGELTTLIDAKLEELRSLRFSASGSKNRNVKLPRELHREIARAKTELRAQSLDSARDKELQKVKLDSK